MINYSTRTDQLLNSSGVGDPRFEICKIRIRQESHSDWSQLRATLLGVHLCRIIICSISVKTRKTSEEVVLILSCQRYLFLSQAHLCWSSLSIGGQTFGGLSHQSLDVNEHGYNSNIIITSISFH